MMTDEELYAKQWNVSAEYFYEKGDRFVADPVAGTVRMRTEGTGIRYGPI